MSNSKVLVDDYRFNGVFIPPVAASQVGGLPFVSKITKTSGSPTVVGVSGGGVALALTSDVEVQNLCLYQGDVLPYPIDKLIQVDIWAKVTASLASAVSVAFGMASARNDAIASVAQHALFSLTGNNNLLLDVIDGTNSQTAVATGTTLGTSWQRHTINFKEGIVTVAGGLSTGGKSNIYMSTENAQGLARRVLTQSYLSMAAYTGNLQLFAQIQKTSNAATGTLTIERMRVQYRPY